MSHTWKTFFLISLLLTNKTHEDENVCQKPEGKREATILT